jgi:hypothetical protein
MKFGAVHAAPPYLTRVATTVAFVAALDVAVRGITPALSPSSFRPVSTDKCQETVQAEVGLCGVRIVRLGEDFVFAPGTVRRHMS